MEAVYWYNVTPKDDIIVSTAPTNSVHMYQARIKGIDVAPSEHTDPGIYKVRDAMWVKIPYGRCSTRFKKRNGYRGQ